MQDHLRVHFETEEASDEAVLSVFPGTIRWPPLPPHIVPQ